MPAAILLLLAAFAATDYAGAGACAKCHPAESRLQASSAHARSLAPSNVEQPGQWAFGAGRQAITFVRRLDPENYLEEGQTWYRRINGFAPTPGAASGAGTRYRVFDPDAGILRCFACHSTGALAVGADGAIVPQENGVRCEACHGAAAGHAGDPAASRPFNPGRLPAGELNTFCGNCHRMPAGPEDTPDLRNPWNARHQPLLLGASACFLQSKGRLSCLTCHSAHGPVERRLAAYDATCSKCHGAVRHAQAVAGRACAGCHMPSVKVGGQLAFANHRIAVYGMGDALTPVVRRR
jgi:Zn finger protein HypA/HybF involved in hydrogenase expression